MVAYGLLMLKKLKIVVTGGSGRFGTALKEFGEKYNYVYPLKKQLNILDVFLTTRYLKKTKPKYVLHLAGLSRPMNIHNEKIKKSIQLNIIGTANLVNICSTLNIKLIYLSTNYIYPKKSGSYSETDSLLPINNYAWSKLGGECAVQMYNNSLIIRACVTEFPFIHKYAFSDMFTNFIFHKDFIKIMEKILTHKGVLNIGGKSMSVYNFARKYNPEIKKSKIKKINTNEMPKKSLMNLSKLSRLLKK